MQSHGNMGGSLGVLSLGEIRYGDAVSWHADRGHRAGGRGRGQMSSILNTLRFGVSYKTL